MKRFLVSILLIVLLFGVFSCKKKNNVAEDVFYQVEFSTSALPFTATPPDGVRVKAGEAISAPVFDVEPTAGYVVVWVKDPQTKETYDFTACVTESFTLYAVEVPRSYKVVYLMERGTNSKANPTVFTKATETIYLQAPNEHSHFGYRFVKWAYYDDPDSSVTVIEKGTEGDIVLRAVFSPVTYDVAYENPGDQNPNPTTYEFGTTLTLQTPQREGFDFCGYTIADDTSGTVVTELTAEFVEAHWSALVHKDAHSLYLKANWERN